MPASQLGILPSIIKCICCSATEWKADDEDEEDKKLWEDDWDDDNVDDDFSKQLR